MRGSLGTRGWNYCFLAIVGTFLAFQAGTNYYYDHYGVFGHGLSAKEPINFNQRHGKIEYLSQQRGAYNAFLLGSSRLGHFDTTLISEEASRHEGKKLAFYNLSVFSGVPKDYLAFLQYLKRNEHPLDEVVIGLDMYPFFLPPDMSKPDFRHHPSVTGESSISFYLGYLFRTSFVYLATEMQYFFGNQPAIYAHSLSDGTYTPVRTLSELKDDYDGYWLRELKRAEKGMEAFQATDHVVDAGQLKDLIDLAVWLESNVESYRFFINPRHPLNDAYYSSSERHIFEKMVGGAVSNHLASVSVSNCILGDNRNFYDLMHYKPLVADQIVKSIYGQAYDKGERCPKD